MKWSLYDARGRRKYLVPIERDAFLGAAVRIGGPTSTFCAVLVFTGARITEVLSLTAEMIDDANGAINFHTLKRHRRKSGEPPPPTVVVRSVPVPMRLLRHIELVHQHRERQRSPRLATTRLWEWSRTTGWRRVKVVMLLARVPGFIAMPKAVRHAFGAAATTRNITLSMTQKWLVS
ncbi:MAG: hypothetical protein WDM91_17475 [Rhizomicrobium sp.]